jgi:diadenosine tetraphosphate (Ap4A) HIT family hydrolase
MNGCLICERVKSAQEGKNSFLIREFKNSVFVIGDHQFFKGYSLLLLKDHVRELHELAPDIQQELFQELMTAGKAVFETFKPWKMNYSCYGNEVPHIHWHIFPRYESDPFRLNNPWLNSAQFKEHPTKETEREKLIEKIRLKLKTQ